MKYDDLRDLVLDKATKRMMSHVAHRAIKRLDQAVKKHNRKGFVTLISNEDHLKLRRLAWFLLEKDFEFSIAIETARNENP